MVCLLGAYMLPFQIYAHAKSKEDQTATRVQKLKSLSTHILYE